MTLSRLAQGIMRMRKFLLSIGKWEESQRLIWVVPEALKEKIQNDLELDKNTEISLKDIWDWTILNEGGIQKEAIWACSIQEIEFLFRQHIRPYLDEATRAKNWEVRNQYWKRHQKAFALACGRDPFLLWGGAKKNYCNAKFLLDYAKTLGEQCGIPLDGHNEIQEKVEKIIEQTEKLIKEVSTHTTQSGRSRIQQKQREKQKEQQKQQENRKESYGSPSVYKELPYVQNEWSLTKEWSSPTTMPECRTANDLYGTELLPPNLFVLSNAYHTLRNEANPVHFKPYHYLLLVEEQDAEKNWKRSYYLIGQYDGEEYQKQLLTGESRSGRRAALFSPNRKIIQNGKKNLGIPADTIHAILNKKDAEAIRIFSTAQLLNGKIEDRASFEKFYAESKKPVKALLERIVNGAIDREGISTGVITNIVDMEFAPEVPGVPGVPEAPSVPEVPGVPGVPEAPELPGAPSVPEAPEVPGAPNVPEAPEVPEAPNVPEAPEVPGTPEDPEKPTPPKDFQPPSKSPKISAAQFVKYLWKKSRFFRTFSFLTLGILPLIAWFIGWIRSKKSPPEQPIPTL